MQISWLLHLEATECFHIPPSVRNINNDDDTRNVAAIEHKENVIEQHFQSLTRKGCTMFAYKNMEAVPHKANIQNPFSEITLFRQHFTDLDIVDSKAAKQSTQPQATTAAQSAVEFWRQRGNYRQYFFGDQAGKMAVRTCPDITCISVSEFAYPRSIGEIEVGKLTNNSLFFNVNVMGFN